MEEGRLLKIAMLVDGDNAQPALLKPILEEVSKYGKVTIKRIYGDWTQPTMNGWKNILNELSYQPMQKFSYTTGKNSTDGALIIDAMDILHGHLVDSFCIVSSDSDFTGLAKRIRENGLLVIGIGHKKTPKAFVNSCEKFIYCENIIKELKDSNIEEDITQNDETQIPYTVLVDKAFENIIGDRDSVYIAQLGTALNQLDTAFDTRTYGFRNLTQMVKSIKKYDVVNNGARGLNHPLVKLKQQASKPKSKPLRKS